MLDLCSVRMCRKYIGNKGQAVQSSCAGTEVATNATKSTYNQSSQTLKWEYDKKSKHWNSYDSLQDNQICQIWM
jgi:hypothetical protein